MTPGFIYTPRIDHTVLKTGGNDEIPSLLVIIPEQNLALFMATIGRLPGHENQSVIDRFLDSFFPNPVRTEIPASPEAASRSAELAGAYYLPGILGKRNIKIPLHLSPVTVTPCTNGDLRITTGRWDWDYYREVEPNLYRSLNGRKTLSFHDGGPGKPPAIIIPNGVKFIRLEQGMPLPTHFLFLLTTIGILASYLVLWPIGSLIRIIRGLPPLPPLARVTGWTLGSVALLGCCFGLGYPLVYVKQLTLMMEYGEIGHLRTLLFLPLVAFWPTIALPFLVGKSWVDGWWSLPWRFYASIVVFAAVVFLAELYFWNFLGFNF